MATNTTIDFGMFLQLGTSPYAPNGGDITVAWDASGIVAL